MWGSNPVEHEKLKCVQHTVVPVQHQMLLLDLLAPLHYQLEHIVEVRLPQWHLVWIDVILFEFCEKKLCWREIITVWTTHHNWNL